jgi:hypothetical protein
MRLPRATAYLRALRRPLLGVAVAAAVGACSQQKSGASAGGGSGADKSEAGDKGTAAGTTGGGALTGGDLKGFCGLAAETDPGQGDLADLLKDFCDGDSPTELLTRTLVETAYAGSGKPQMTEIQAATSEGKTTSVRLGIGIKIPITIKRHFDQVGPRGGDVEKLKQLAEANGAKAEVEVKKKYAKDGPHQVRGWLTYSKATTSVGPIELVTEQETRADQFLLKDAKLYLYTQHVEKAIQTVKVFDMLTAGVQGGKDGKDAYLLTVVDVKIDNRGAPETALAEIRKVASATIKYMYKAAADAGGGDE